MGSSVNIPNSQTNSYSIIQQSSSNSATGTPAYRQSQFASGGSGSEEVKVQRATSIITEEHVLGSGLN